MADAFVSLARTDQRDALGVAATKSGRPAHLLEKDVWVVWSINALFSSPFGEHLVFKGGTSLSKGYDIIKRFSEDVDVTHDVRRLLPEFAAEKPVPATNSQAKKWSDAIRERLPAWVAKNIVALLEAYAAKTGAKVAITAEGDKAYVTYDLDAKGDEYVARRVTLEFGARSTGEPVETKHISCDAAPLLPQLEFPTAEPRVMLPKRTFWEKATASPPSLRPLMRRRRAARPRADQTSQGSQEMTVVPSIPPAPVGQQVPPMRAAASDPWRSLRSAHGSPLLTTGTGSAPLDLTQQH